ncbi:MAG: AraC family transcriptional regulator, partial [Panacibacter sp.]
MAFIVPPTVELLDLAGPVQVFTEAKFYGYDVSLEFYSYHQDIICSSQLPFGKIANFNEAALNEGDFV